MAKLRVAVLDMQPIEPATGGGRLRLLGLYSGFKNEIDVTYVGSYDWRGPGYRDHKLSECLREIDVPFSEEHFQAHDALSAELGKGCIDTAFPMQGHLSEAFILKAQEEAKKAEVVIFSHQWLFPFVAPVIDGSKQLIVYDSHNCEGLLRVKLLDDGTALADKICREAVRCEYDLCHAADLILACSQEDKNSFISLYGVAPDKIIIVPNGVFTSQITPCEAEKKAHLRKKLDLTKPTACFIGSNYYPNEEAARLIIKVADSLKQYQFVIIGGVGESLKDINLLEHPNLIVTGFVEEQEKLDYLAASDIAVNPMLSGSGTNIKMFDFMAAGLPIITTEIGARGIENTNGRVYLKCDKNNLGNQIERLVQNPDLRENLKLFGRREAEERYSWEQISYELGYKLHQKYKFKIKKHQPYYSIIIPSYERHKSLTKLLERLKSQTFQDFEVIIVDQSEKHFAELEQFQPMCILYFKTSIKGAVKARNTGIRLSVGQVAAFIDDDCVPDVNWLKNASKYLATPGCVGVEGLIEADIYDRVNYRVVTNINFEGIGFMTANLFVRLDTLRKIYGFDESFDNPHFREDTDLGWRIQNKGSIPYGRDVIVLHPSHKRVSVRESAEERNKFYVHDPLLLKKHGKKFVDLFLAEGHYKESAYWHYFLEGLRRHHVSSAELQILTEDERIDKSIFPKKLLHLLKKN